MTINDVKTTVLVIEGPRCETIFGYTRREFSLNIHVDDPLHGFLKSAVFLFLILPTFLFFAFAIIVLQSLN
jgi:hypothetical protein